jgi:protein phosphatase
MQAYGLTDVGRVRTHNQDYLYSSSEPVGKFQNLFLVADGMGGHQAGDFASRFVVESLVSYLEHHWEGQIIAELQNGIQKVNEALYAKSMEEPSLRGMGTTLVAATIEENTLYVANIGDSRLYLYRNGQLTQITRDHSYVEEMVALGQIRRNSQDYLKHKNIITRAVGTENRVRADFFEESLLPGDLILMCSDGLSNMTSAQEMIHCLDQECPLSQKAKYLIDTANQNGGRDNIATVLIEPQISEVTLC